MGVQLKNWNRAGHLLEGLPERFNKRVDDVLMKNAEIYKEAILMMIEQGNENWIPKSDHQSDRSGSEQLFIGSTGTFYSNLDRRGIRRVRSAKGVKRIYVGARYDIKHEPSGLSMEKLADILQNLPGPYDRDLFGPAWEQVQDKIRANLTKLRVGLNDTDGRGRNDDDGGMGD
jgi:hypothetical protein